MARPKKASFVCMAGGKGTRFRPLTRFLQKELYPIAGKPFLAYTLDNLVGLTWSVTIAVSKNKHQFEAYFQNEYKSLEIEYLDVSECKTLLDSVKAALEKSQQDLIMWLGDTYVPKTVFEEMLWHKGNAVSVAPTSFSPIAPLCVKDGYVSEQGQVYAHSGVYRFNFFNTMPYFVQNRTLPEKPIELIRLYVKEGFPVKAVINPIWLHLGDKKGRSWTENQNRNEHAFMEVSTFFTNSQFMLCPGQVTDVNLEQRKITVKFNSEQPMKNYHERYRNPLKDWVVAAAAFIFRTEIGPCVALVKRCGLADNAGKWALIPAGASDNLSEMLNPKLCLDRETREELIFEYDGWRIDPLSACKPIENNETEITIIDKATGKTGGFTGHIFETDHQLIVAKIYEVTINTMPLIRDGEKNVGELLNRDVILMPLDQLEDDAAPYLSFRYGQKYTNPSKIDLAGSQAPTLEWFRRTGIKNVINLNG